MRRQNTTINYYIIIPVLKLCIIIIVQTSVNKPTYSPLTNKRTAFSKLNKVYKNKQICKKRKIQIAHATTIKKQPWAHQLTQSTPNFKNYMISYHDFRLNCLCANCTIVSRFFLSPIQAFLL